MKFNFKQRTNIPPSSPITRYAIVDGGASQHLHSSAAGMQNIIPCGGAVETAEAGVELTITAKGRMRGIPGDHYVVPGLGDDLISFHELERHGLLYRRHPTRPELREWLRDGRVVDDLTYRVYEEMNIGLLHPDGARHEYPQEYPLGKAARAYRMILRDPVVSVTQLEGSLAASKGAVVVLGAGVVLGVDSGDGVGVTRKVTFAENVRSRCRGYSRKAWMTAQKSLTASKDASVGGLGKTLRWSTGNSFALLVDTGDGGEEENSEHTMETEAGASQGGQLCTLGARKATKMWSTVRTGPSAFLPVILHMAVHLSQERLVGVVEQQLMLNLPPSLTPALIRESFPDCCACIRGKSQHVERDTTRVGDALLRAEVPHARVHRDVGAPRQVGDLVSLDLMDWSGGVKPRMLEGFRYAVVAVDCSSGRYVSVQPIAGKNAESILVAIDKIVQEYAKYGRKIKTIRSDGEFAAGTTREMAAVHTGILTRGILVENSAPYEHAQNGVVERFIQTLERHLRATLEARHPDCPYLWVRAMDYFVLLWNATSGVSVGVSAYTQFTGKKWDFERFPMLPWGARVEALEEPTPTNNMDPRTFSGFNMGIAMDNARSILVMRKGAETHSPLLIRRSFWMFGHPSVGGVEPSAKCPVEEVGRWFGADLALDGPVQEEELERREMEMEDFRGASVLMDQKNVRWGEALDLERRRRISIQERALSDHELRILVAEQRLKVKRSVQQGVVESKEKKRLEKYFRRVLVELMKTVRVRERDRDSRGVRVSGEQFEGGRRSGRKNIPTQRAEYAYTAKTHGLLNNLEEDTSEVSPGLQGLAPLGDIAFLPDPRGWKKMLSHPRCEEFLKAVDAEVLKLTQMGAGKVVRGGRRGVPVTEHILRSSFVFATKRFADSGEIEKFKARLVADGSGQRDVDETHAPTIGGTSLRVLLAVAAQRGYCISKLDVESAFLIEDVDRPTYVQLPKEYTDYLGKPTEVWELIRSLYGLRQAPRLFWLGMQSALQGLGFRSSDHDPCLFVRRESDGTCTYVATHVDDCAVVSASVETNQGVRDGLLLKYKGVKWEDQAETFVGLALRRGQSGNLLVHQPAYTRHVCDVLGVAADGVTFSPNGGALLSKGVEGEKVDMDLVPWLRLAVGMVQYLTFTRMEIALALNLVAKNMHKPCTKVKAAMEQILRYLANRPDDGLRFKSGGNVEMQCWCDASWQSEPGNGSRTGYAICVGSDAAMVVSHSKVQTYATLSSQHAEIVALTEAVRAVRHVRMLLEDMGIPQLSPTPVWEDNVGAIAFSNATSPLEKTKHVANRDRYCREAVREGIVVTKKIGTLVNPVNGLTKEVSRDEQENMRKFLQQGRLFVPRATAYVARMLSLGM